MATSLLRVLAAVSLACALAGAEELTVKDVLSKKVKRIETLSQIAHFSSLPNQPGLDKLREPAVVANAALSGRACLSTVAASYSRMHDNNFGFIPDSIMPKPLERFIRTLGYQIVATCKLQLPLFAHKADQELQPEELSLVQRFERAGSGLLNSTFSSQSTDIVRVTSKLLQLLTHAPLSVKTHINFSSSSLDLMRQMNVQCRGSYDKVGRWFLQTLLTLIGLGYDYPMGAELTPGAPSSLNSDPSVRRWLNLLLTCKALSQSPDFYGLSVFVDTAKADTEHFMAGPMNELRLDQDKAADQVKKLVKESSSEADKIVGQIYKQTLGSSANIFDEMGKNSGKFWLAYIKLLNQKLA